MTAGRIEPGRMTEEHHDALDLCEENSHLLDDCESRFCDDLWERNWLTEGQAAKLNEILEKVDP